MPVKVEITPPPPSQSKQLGFPKTLLYNGSKFEGSQKSKGNSYAVEVVLQVSIAWKAFISYHFGNCVSANLLQWKCALQLFNRKNNAFLLETIFLISFPNLIITIRMTSILDLFTGSYHIYNYLNLIHFYFSFFFNFGLIYNFKLFRLYTL